ncbi:MAG: hypothetical protein KC912_04390 [Proteobacteria bacterium]|nr:hypothetical protein [Pseudomonadota bacterium]
MTDLERVRRALRPIEERARDLRWADERPWRLKSHTWDEQGLAVVDLHDLNAKVGRLAATAVQDVAADLDSGAVLFVVGVGRRSAGPPVLGAVVLKVLHEGPFRGRRAAQGRVALISDASRAPAAATGGSGWGMTLLWLFFASAVFAVLVNSCLS